MFGTVISTLLFDDKWGNQSVEEVENEVTLLPYCIEEITSLSLEIHRTGGICGHKKSTYYRQYRIMLDIRSMMDDNHFYDLNIMNDIVREIAYTPNKMPGGTNSEVTNITRRLGTPHPHLQKKMHIY
jgi:hypothetical protein